MVVVDEAKADGRLVERSAACEVESVIANSISVGACVDGLLACQRMAAFRLQAIGSNRGEGIL